MRLDPPPPEAAVDAAPRLTGLERLPMPEGRLDLPQATLR
jgi:hypothetical protein